MSHSRVILLASPTGADSSNLPEVQGRAAEERGKGGRPVRFVPRLRRLSDKRRDHGEGAVGRAEEDTVLVDDPSLSHYGVWEIQKSP